MQKDSHCKLVHSYPGRDIAIRKVCVCVCFECVCVCVCVCVLNVFVLGSRISFPTNARTNLPPPPASPGGLWPQPQHLR